MGTWGTGLLENDHMLDWMDGFADQKTLWEPKDFHKFEKGGLVTGLVWKKSQFSKNFSKLLKGSKVKGNGRSKYTNVMTFDIMGQTHNKQLAPFKKLNGQWYHEQVLTLYVWGRRCGYRFDKAFLELVRFAAYFRMGYGASFFSLDSAEQSVKEAKRIISSLNKPYPVQNLYSVLHSPQRKKK